MNARESLIELLIGGPEAAAGACTRIVRENAWPAILDLAAAWNVIPNLRQRLLELQAPLSEELKNRLFTKFREVFVSSTLHARRGAYVCGKLEEHGVPAVVFKGLASIAHLHQGNPSGRTIKDVDILVLEKDLDHALGVMEELGLKPEDGGNFAQYAAFVRNSPGFAGNQAVSVSGKGVGELDVHWSIGPRTAAEFRIESILERSVWMDLFENRVRVISPADGLLLSAHHAVRENFAPDGMLRDVLDAIGWRKLLDESGDLQNSLDRARRCGIEGAVLGLMGILADSGAVPAPDRTPPNAAALAQLFRLQTSDGALGKDFTYLADPHSAGLIFRGILSGWTGYSAQMRAFETKLTGNPISLSQRFTVLARQLPRYGLRGWKMIRVLAKTKAACQRGMP